MEEFCGEPLLDLSSAWHTSSPRLSQCLSRTVSTSVNLICLFLSTSIIRIILKSCPEETPRCCWFPRLWSCFSPSSHPSSSSRSMSTMPRLSLITSLIHLDNLLGQLLKNLNDNVPQEKSSSTSLSRPILLRLFLLLLALVSFYLSDDWILWKFWSQLCICLQVLTVVQAVVEASHQTLTDSDILFWVFKIFYYIIALVNW